MSPRLRIPIAIAVMALVAALLCWRPGFRAAGPAGSRPHAAPTAPAPRPSLPANPANPDAPPAIDRTNTDPRFIRFSDGTVHLTASMAAANRLHQSAEPQSDLQILDQLIADYRLVYRENPVGTENTEILEQLLGKNPKKVFFLDPKHPALTAEGDLLDRWGSPYIFHPLKADVMDIRSIGPDQKPWTPDDLTLGLEDTETELQLNP